MKSWIRTGVVILLAVGLVFSFALAQQHRRRGGGFSGTPTAVPPGWYQKSVALVVGIDQYSQGWPALRASVSDARKVEDVFRRQGFRVYLLLNQQATKAEILRHLYDVIPPDLSANDRFVFYFSGHGQTERVVGGHEMGYLIPVDGRKANGQDQFSTYLSMEEIKTVLMNKYNAKHVLLVADACFSGLLARGGNIRPVDVQQALRQEGRMVLTAGQQDEPAVDGLFTSVFVQGISGAADANGDGYVTFNELVLYSQQHVTARSNGQQNPMAQPWEPGGQMVFHCGDMGQGGGETPTPTPPPPPPPVVEQTPQPQAAGDMVLLPGGTFIMGCVDGDSQCANDEKPAHRVNLNSFYMDVHDVTVAEYTQCVSAGVCKAARASTDQWAEFYNLNNAYRENHPINGVDWNDANTYCGWRQKRLPTEAEFEYALRGGSQGYIYPWGNNSTPPQGFGNYADESFHRRFANYGYFAGYDDGYVGTSPVCSFTRNAYGLCDISGNVWEWTADWYDSNYYQSSPSNNPRGPSSGSSRVLRGGGWFSGPRDTRASIRFDFRPGLTNFLIGFRCSRD